jgi:hypothetical protein
VHTGRWETNGKKKQEITFISICVNIYHQFITVCCGNWAWFFSVPGTVSFTGSVVDPSVDARIPMTLGPRTKQSRPRPASVGQSWHTIGWPHLKTGEWFGTMEFYDFPYWEFHHPN